MKTQNDVLAYFYYCTYKYCYSSTRTQPVGIESNEQIGRAGRKAGENTHKRTMQGRKKEKEEGTDEDEGEGVERERKSEERRARERIKGTKGTKGTKENNGDKDEERRIEKEQRDFVRPTRWQTNFYTQSIKKWLFTIHKQQLQTTNNSNNTNNKQQITKGGWMIAHWKNNVHPCCPWLLQPNNQEHDPFFLSLFASPA